MNYAAAFAQALQEDLDRRNIQKRGPYGVSRPDPTKVDQVEFDGDEGYDYSEYTHADPRASLVFRGPDNYYCEIDMTQVGSLNLGEILERAAYIMQLPGL